jgi:SAM-dependent methyltransferase
MTDKPYSFGMSFNYGAPPQSKVEVPPKPRILFEVCPLCDSRGIGLLRSADCAAHPLYLPVVARMMNWLRCDDCSHVFTDGYFTSEVLNVIFEKTNEHQKPGWNFEQQRFVSARMVGSVAKLCKDGAWLDVGFGDGSLLLTAEEFGFAPVGLDMRPSSVAALLKLGIEAHCADVATLDEPGRYSVVSMADVLEHMPFPRKGLAAAHRLLKPDGVLFVSMPNYDCGAWRLLDATNTNPYWGEIEHYHNFSRARLYALLDEMGFDPIRYGVSERYRICMEVLARKRS